MARIVVRSEDVLRTAIQIRQHTVFADELIETGGTDTAPEPPELLVGALGACMVITSQLYARRKNWPLEEVTISLEHERFKKEDYPAYHGDAAYVNEFRYTVEFGGSLSDEQKARLLEIANRCPVHRTLEYPSFFVSELGVTPVKEG